MSNETMNAQKMILDAVKKEGGASNVKVGFKLLNRVKTARLEQKRDLEEKAKVKKERKRKIQEEEEENRKKKVKEDWDSKKKKLESEIKAKKAEMSEQNSLLSSYIDKAMKSKKEVERLSSLNLSKVAKDNVDKISKALFSIQSELQSHLAKKPNTVKSS